LGYVKALVLLYLKLLSGYFYNCKHNCPKLGVQNYVNSPIIRNFQPKKTTLPLKKIPISRN
jgi:hypothetical protein